jgi:hypothetical protein
MKTPCILGMVIILMLAAGCATQHKGPAYGHEQEFRTQVEKCRAVTYYSEKVVEVRFAPDFQAALVLFAPKHRPELRQEVILQHIGFGRYCGTLYRTETGTQENEETPPGIPIRIVIPAK